MSVLSQNKKPRSEESEEIKEKSFVLHNKIMAVVLWLNDKDEDEHNKGKTAAIRYIGRYNIMPPVWKAPISELKLVPKRQLSSSSGISRDW